MVSAAGIAACACHGKLAFDWKHPVRREVADEEQKRKALPRYDYEKEALHRIRPLRGGEKLWLGIDVGSTSTNLVLTGRTEPSLTICILERAAILSARCSREWHS